jgi:hypothetical protein
LAGCLICIGIIIVVLALRVQTSANVALEETTDQDIDATTADKIIEKFPGPIILYPSRLKWWIFAILAGGMTAACAWLLAVVCVHPSRVVGDARGAVVAIALVGIAFFGLCTATFVIFLYRGALRLDRDGFEVTLLRGRRYRWSEVRDFRAFQVRAAAGVMFKATKPRWRTMGSFNALLNQGRNDSLPDTYGFGANRLAKLMAGWQRLANGGSHRPAT